MKCILLCAGYATRLFPLTQNFPKALLKVGQRAIIDYILEKVNKIDEVDKIYLVTNAKYSEHFTNWANEKNNVKPITVFNDGTTSNDDRLGAIGDIQFVIDNSKLEDDILVIATDNLFDFELKDFYDFYKTKNSPCVCVRKEDYENNKVIQFEEKPADPKGEFAVYAEYIYPRDVVPEIKKYLDEGNSCDAPGNLITYLYNKFPTYAYEFTGDCHDVGTHEALAYVNEVYKDKK